MNNQNRLDKPTDDDSSDRDALIHSVPLNRDSLIAVRTIHSLTSPEADLHLTPLDIGADALAGPVDDDCQHFLRQHHLSDNRALEDNLRRLDRLPRKEREAIYQSLRHIMQSDTSSTTNLSREQRITLTGEVVQHIIHPETCKSGFKNVRMLSIIESTMARDHPVLYSQTLAELATTGKLTGIGIQTGESQRVPEVSEHDILGDDGCNGRALSSKLFHIATANLALREQNAQYASYKPGEAPPGGKHKTPIDDSGDRLIDGNGSVHAWPDLTTDQGLETLQMLTGDRYQCQALYPTSANELQEKLTAESAIHGYPLIMSLTTPDGSRHAIDVTAIDNSSSPVTIRYLDRSSPSLEPLSLSLAEFHKVMMIGPSLGKPGGDAGNPQRHIEILHKT